MSGQWGNQPPPQQGYNNPDAVLGAKALLGQFPLPSSNTSTHVARHLSSLSISSAPPSSMHPSYYATFPRGRPPPQYTQYPPQAQYLASGPHTNDNGYWDSARNEVSSMISQQTNSSYAPPPQWTLTNGHLSSYRSNPFSQAIMQRTNPATAYPTPPPPSTSSSSLAGALGPPPAQTTGAYHPQQSPAFFEQFMAENSGDVPRPAPQQHRSPPQRPTSQFATFPRMATSPLKAQATVLVDPPRGTTPPPRSRQQTALVQESPDPLTILPSVTPRLKRKSESELVSPHIKRLNSPHTSVPPTPTTSSRSRPSTTTTPSTPSRRITMSHVEITPWKTPKSALKFSLRPPPESPNEFGGYGEESPSKLISPRRTGERDERSSRDGIMPDTDISMLPAEFFSQQTTTEVSHPLLGPAIMRKLIKYIGQVAQGKRNRHANAVGGTPRAQDNSLAAVDVVILSRILKLLERSVKAGEDIDPFPGLPVSHAQAAPGSAQSSPKKPKKKKRRSKSLSGDEGEAETMEVDMGAPAGLTDEEKDKLERALELVRDSMLAVECCFTLMSGGRLPKQLYSEELITSCLNAVKNQLEKVIYPFIEASAGVTPGSQLLQYTLRASEHRQVLGDTYRAITATLPRLSALVNTETVAMSDSIIISAVYIAIGPFFVVDTGEEAATKKERESNPVIKTFGSTAMRALRLDALSLIRVIFANHDNQRDWIIEEILTSLIKLSDTKQKAGNFKLRDGRSIRTVSALLLQLVQTSAHSVRLDAGVIAKARQQKIALRRNESMTESQSQVVKQEPFLDEQDSEEIRLYKTGLDAATKAAKKIIMFLTQRSGKTKTTKNSNEAEYRAIFDHFLSDLLVVLFWPEYPAAALILNIASRYMLTSLDDIKTAQTDNNAAKTMALDHLGVIAARIRTSMLKFQPSESGSKVKRLKPLEDLAANLDVKGLDRLLTAHRDVASHLAKRASEEQAYDTARELSAATLGNELALALEKLDLSISNPDEDDELTLQDSHQLVTFGSKVKSALHVVWKDTSGDVFDAGTSEEATRIDHTAELIGTIQTLKNSFQPILNVILGALDAPPIFMRTKALRALGQIVTSDPTVLGQDNVRRAIENHLLDNSPAVRDAAVELIGKYMIDKPEIAGNYYYQIADRMADTGLAVRKRVIKLLKQYYNVITDIERKVDICKRFVMRMVDEDDTVKELAIKTIEELWFPVPLQSAMRSRASVSAAPDKAALQVKVAVIMGTAAQFADRQSPLEDILHQIISGTESLHGRFEEICEVLIDALVDASELEGFTVINCVRTIYLLTASYPAVLSGSHASTLLPFLKIATTTEEQATNEYLLKVFRAAIPHMPKTSLQFGQELQSKLQPMVAKPSPVAGIQGLHEAVACMCTVVQCLTHDFPRLFALLKSCNTRIQQATTVVAKDTRPLAIFIVITALLCEYCDFEKIRQENPEHAPILDSITTGSIIEHIFDSFLKLYYKYEDLSVRLLHSLGCLFRAQPTLMTTDRSAAIMDSIFASQDEDRRGRLLKMFQEFLISEAEKHAAKQKDTAAAKTKAKPTDVNMDELVGNTDGFADSGVSSAVVQRYLTHILDAALSPHPHIQAAAIDVLTFTIKQGLAHPLQSFPVIVALETSPNPNLSGRATALHSLLHQKHSSLLNTRHIPSARASFEYQCKVVNPVLGYHPGPPPLALLNRWYSLVKEKRPTRQEFLRLLGKVFHPARPDEASQADVDFTRYMAENFASLDYKTQEEVITVIKDLTTVLSVEGMRVLEIVSPGHLVAQLRSTEMEVDADAAEDAVDRRPFMRATVVICIIMLLKAHLKELYSLSEDKCSKFVLNKKSAVGDRAAQRRHTQPISWDRLPFATAPILTLENVKAQKAQFITIWNEDGVAAEPPDDLQ
ncbi:Sister chromatid cohesion protein [Mycena kentingensis (nom. inval.)]|nr:Sister chromatid cohesion protein [Mycena kentingensis (nom. inval.)]